MRSVLECSSDIDIIKLFFAMVSVLKFNTQGFRNVCFIGSLDYYK
jgi:hypothetical protein